MKSVRNMKKGMSLLLIIATFISCTSSERRTQDDNEEVSEDRTETTALAPPINEAEATIKLALLLDTSSSMDGLIEQAKSQLWKIVNQLSIAKKGDEYARLRIALYEYGNDGLEESDGYVRQILGLTDDLDEISKELFALTTNGGDEYCGEVIARSLSELEWEKETEGLQVMVVAGNEPFTQGGTNYEISCADASASDIVVNTIFCGNIDEGIETKWKHGADLTEGFYGNIDMNEATVYIDTPYDEDIQQLNTKLNNTYLAYGSQKDYYKENQLAQDENSSSYGTANSTERTITKSKSVYKNTKWDLVDASEEESFDVNKVKDEDLPEEMKAMTAEEKEDYVKTKKVERDKIKTEIGDLDKKRMVYIEEKMDEMGESNGLDGRLLEAIREQAEAKGFVFDEL